MAKSQKKRVKKVSKYEYKIKFKENPDEVLKRVINIPPKKKK